MPESKNNLYIYLMKDSFPFLLKSMYFEAIIALVRSNIKQVNL